MGFYIRKSIKAGPFRFNLSKSGLGVSAGVPGFRLSTGPRGHYVNMGRHGVYYRSSLNSKVRASSKTPRRALHLDDPAYSPHDSLVTDVKHASALTLEPSGGDEVIEQLNSAARWLHWGVACLVVAFLLGLAAVPASLLIWIVGIPLGLWMLLHDQGKRSVVLFYDVRDAHSVWFDELLSEWQKVLQCQQVFRILQPGETQGNRARKKNVAASDLGQRERADVSAVGPRHLKTNIAVPSIVAGKSGLYFLPDRLLVKTGRTYSDVPYGDLAVKYSEEQFIETSDQPPTDAQRVAQTWQYANLKGWPDGGGVGDQMLPVMLYGYLELSGGGLDWCLQTSRTDAALNVGDVLTRVPV